MVAGFSDNAGRRPAYIAYFTLYMGANMALTVQHSYLGLLILRCFQSAGSSAMVALCQGIVADVATAADRGTYVAYASVSTILGPTLSPADWRLVVSVLWLESHILVSRRVCGPGLCVDPAFLTRNVPQDCRQWLHSSFELLPHDSP